MDLYETLDKAMRSNNRVLTDCPGCTKPCEDYLLSEPDLNLFIVLDGITRPHGEYKDAPGKSAACEVNEIFVENAVRHIRDNVNEPDAEKLLRAAVKAGNDEIRAFRVQKDLAKWVFYPGTLGIIALIRNSRLHYICAGDCVGMIVRGSSKICFGEQLSLAALELLKPNKKERYLKYCNHPENDLSYTIFNGDECVPEHCEYAYIDLQQDDMVILGSDGIKNYLKYEKIAVIKNTQTERLIDLSETYDLHPYGEYGDDKSLMKFTFRG